VIEYISYISVFLSEISEFFTGNKLVVIIIYCYLSETENIGKEHLSLAQHLLDDLEKATKDFKETQRTKRKQVKQTNLFRVLPTSRVFL
jgi:hypothetical protein